MRDLALQAGGVLAILVVIGHGAIAELRVFRKARIEPQWARNLLRGVWQLSTVDWIGSGCLLIAAPSRSGRRSPANGSLRWLLSYTGSPLSATPWRTAGGTLVGA